MKLCGAIAVVVAAVVSVVALAMRVDPGVLNGLAFIALLLSFSAVPVVAIVGSLTLAWRARQGHFQRVTIPIRSG